MPGQWLGCLGCPLMQAQVLLTDLAAFFFFLPSSLTENVTEVKHKVTLQSFVA